MAAKGKSLLRPRWCNHDGCDVRIILALRADTGKCVPYEAADQSPDAVAAGGCHVLVGTQAWRRADLIEHFQVTFQITTDRAEALVVGYPHHRPHFHTTDEETS